MITLFDELIDAQLVRRRAMCRLGRAGFAHRRVVDLRGMASRRMVDDGEFLHPMGT